MESGWRQIFKNTGRISVALGLALLPFGCQFDTTVPLQNNPPHWSFDQTLRRTLLFPDSALCTLRVEDLNDTALAFRACFTDDSADTTCDNLGPWPWSCQWSEAALGERSIRCSIDPCCLGVFFGRFRISDNQGAAMVVPFSFSMVIADPFNRYPITPEFWTPEPLSDSTFIGFDFLNEKLKFAFSVSTDSTAANPASTGLRSRFALSGDMETSVQFQLRDDMREGFEVAFRISTSPSAGPWDGEKTGFLITGLPNQVRFTCSSINMQTDSRDVSRNFTEFGGYLSIARKTDSVTYQFIPGDPQLPMLPMNKFSFPADSAVFVHIRMSVTDRLRARHCLWSDFRVTKGRVRF
jgi:hypothetical protein